MRIATKKTDYSSVSSRVGSTANMDHRPGGGEKKVYPSQGMVFVNLFLGEKFINISSIEFSFNVLYFWCVRKQDFYVRNMTKCLNIN